MQMKGVIEMEVNHQRKAFQYATMFLQNEINSIKNSLKMCDFSTSIRKTLEQRVLELEKDYDDLVQYGFDK